VRFLVHFLLTCISPYFIIVYAAYSVYKKFLMLPFSLLFIRQGASLGFRPFVANLKVIFFTAAFRLILFVSLLLNQFIRNF